MQCPSRRTPVVVAAVALSLFAHAAWAQTPAKLTFERDGASPMRFSFYPIRVALAPAKPALVRKEPAYRVTPKYATIRLGNGPKGLFAVAVDEPEAGDWRIYVDANGNGDLTDDGDGAWVAKKDVRGRLMYGTNLYVLRASYGTAQHETSSSDYAIGVYQFMRTDYLIMYRRSARAGTVELDGKPHKAVLVENDTDGIFRKPVSKRDDAAQTGSVWLKIDLADDGLFSSGLIDVRAPFSIGGVTYEADVATDGSTLALKRTAKPALDLAVVRPGTHVRNAGAVVPDFVTEKWGGGELRLSGYRGKIVVIGLWATGSRTCEASLQHLEKVWQAVKDQGVAVVGVCVRDDRDNYAKWVAANASKYTFQFAFDPAGRAVGGITDRVLRATGLPMAYVIDKDGKLADGFHGFTGEADRRVEEALRVLGVKVE